MKKQFLLIAIVLMAIATSCKKNGGDGQKISLHSLNVADAKSIFKKTSDGTRSSNGEGSYWKIDKSGKESKLVLSDANNTTQGDIEITSLVKLSDEILLLQIEGTYTTTITDAEGSHETTTWKQGIFFANTESERLFEVPGAPTYTNGVDYSEMWAAVSSISYSSYVDVKEDKDGMLYIKSGYDQIIKLDTRSYTLSFELPDNQHVIEFDVTSDGFIFYQSHYGKDSKVKCLGGKIVVLGDDAFMCNDEIYSLEGKNIYRWKRIGNNDLEKVLVCEFYEKPTYDGGSDYEYNIYNVIENHVNNTVILSIISTAGVFEFDGTNQPTLIENFPDEFNYFDHANNAALVARTENALYIFDDNKLSRLDLLTPKVGAVTYMDNFLENTVCFFTDIKQCYCTKFDEEPVCFSEDGANL